MRKIIIAVFFAVLAYSLHLSSRPQYAILQSLGTNCSACHLNTQGGGLRTSGGFASRREMSLIPTSSIGMGSAFDGLSTNSAFDEAITFGMDTRLQWAKWPAAGQGQKVPVGTTEYDYMVMQLTPYLSINPTSWLTLEGQYNIAYELYTDKRYLGQNPFAASLYVKPGEDLPNLRVGYFQPTIGMKWDDHTLLGYQFYGAKTSRTPIKPDDYAEMGAQLDYEWIPNLSMSVGAFSSNNLAQYRVNQLKDNKVTNVALIDSGTVSIAGRVFYAPEIGGGFTSYIGGTMFLNGDYRIANAHLGIGKAENYCLLVEYTDAEKKDSRRAISYLMEFTYELSETVLPYVRAERQITRENDEVLKATNTPLTPYYVNQFVFGAHINLLPFFDLLPEYRIVNREHIPGYHSQFAFQVHIWY